MSDENITKLKQLYRKPGYVSAFVKWRCWHTPYTLIEKFTPKEGLIIDMGCGYGLFSNFLALTSEKRNIIGIDLSDRKMKYADKGLLNVSFKTGNIMNSGWAGSKYKAIVLIHLLHHLSSFEQQEELLKICYRNLDKEGIVLVLEIDEKPLWKFSFTKLVDNVAYPGGKFYFRSSSEFVSIFKSTGFGNVRVIQANEGVPLSHVLYVAEK